MGQSAAIAAGERADRTSRRRQLHRVGGPRLDSSRGAGHGGRGAAEHAAQRHPHAATECVVRTVVLRISGRWAGQSHRRGRRPSVHALLFARQRRGGAADRTDHRPPRGWTGVDLSVRFRAPGHGGRDRRRGRRCRRFHAGPFRPADPVRLRRERYHPGDVDVAHPARGRLRRRHRLRPLRAQCRGGLLRRGTRPDARRSGAARLHPLGCRRSGRSRQRRSSGRRHRRSRRGVRLRSACVGRCGPCDPPARRVGELRTRRISA